MKRTALEREFINHRERHEQVNAALAQETAHAEDILSNLTSEDLESILLDELDESSILDSMSTADSSNKLKVAIQQAARTQKFVEGFQTFQTAQKAQSKQASSARFFRSSKGFSQSNSAPSISEVVKAAQPPLPASHSASSIVAADMQSTEVTAH